MVYGTHRAYEGASGDASRSFRDLDLTVESSVRTLREHVGDFDFIIVTGVSGLSVGAPVALKLEKRLLVLRKPNEGSHGMPGTLLGFEDLDTDSRVLFLDDFVSGGQTRSKCIESVGLGRVVGQYQYYYDDVRWYEDGEAERLVFASDEDES